MSRIGRKPIPVAKEVAVTIAEGNALTVKGPKGTLAATFNSDLLITQQDGQIVVERPSESTKHRSLHGLTRTLISNMVIGVTTGYSRGLEITGVGYRVVKQGNNLILFTGFSHPTLVEPPDGISFVVDTPTRLRVEGIDKVQVGEIASKLRGIRPPEPYKGKGIAYSGEKIRRKAGKAGKAAKK